MLVDQFAVKVDCIFSLSFKVESLRAPLHRFRGTCIHLLYVSIAIDRFFVSPIGREPHTQI